MFAPASLFFCENREDKPEQIDYNKKKDTR